MDRFKNFMVKWWVWLLAVGLLAMVFVLNGCAGRVTPVGFEATADNGSTAIIHISVSGSSFGFNSPQAATPSFGQLGNLPGLSDIAKEAQGIIPGIPEEAPVIPPLAPPETPPVVTPTEPPVTPPVTPVIPSQGDIEVIE